MSEQKNNFLNTTQDSSVEDSTSLTSLRESTSELNSYVDVSTEISFRNKNSSCDSIEGVSNDVFIAVENISKVNEFLDDGNDTDSNITKFESCNSIESIETDDDEGYLI